MPISAPRRLYELLVVDDDPADVTFLREAFELSKHPVRLLSAGSVDEGLALIGDPARMRLPDLVLLDLRMPGRDGFEFLEELRRSRAPLSCVPVAVLSTSGAPEDRLKAYCLHANCYIQKPSDFEGYVRVARCVGEFWLNVASLLEP